MNEPAPNSTFTLAVAEPDTGVVVGGALGAVEGTAVDVRQASEINKVKIMNRIVVLCLKDVCVFILHHPMESHRHPPCPIRRRDRRSTVGEV